MKDALKAIRGTERRINALTEARARLRAVVTRATASYSGMPGGSANGDRMLSYMERLEEIDRQLQELAGEYLDLKSGAIDAIRSLGNPRYRDVLTFRYVNGWTWRKIARTLYCDVSTARRWHAAALRELKGKRDRDDKG